MTQSLREEINKILRRDENMDCQVVLLRDEADEAIDQILSLIQSRIPVEMPKFNAKKRIGLDLSLVEDQHNRFVRGFNKCREQMKENLK